MSAPFLAGVAAGYGIAVPVGAIGVLIAGLSARTSLRVGAAAGLGAATADGIYAAMAVLGGAAVAELIAPIATPLRWVAAAVLLGLAGMTAWGAFRSRAATDEPERPATPLRAYAAILGLTLLNPATVIYFAALVIGRGGSRRRRLVRDRRVPGLGQLATADRRQRLADRPAADRASRPGRHRARLQRGDRDPGRPPALKS